VESDEEEEEKSAGKGGVKSYLKKPAESDEEDADDVVGGQGRERCVLGCCQADDRDCA